ncbi:MAG: hypothetical protein ACT4O1_09915 [Gemmatimonadota bacterium]
MKKLLLGCMMLSACASVRGTSAPGAPAEAARHRAALALIAVSNGTTTPLTIAYRSATPPIQEVVIGQVAGGQRLRLAPVPAGEPIVLIARREDGAELSLRPRSFRLDAEWTWEIPHNAIFTMPEPAR